jgi:hypothetical protein
VGLVAELVAAAALRVELLARDLHHRPRRIPPKLRPPKSACVVSCRVVCSFVQACVRSCVRVWRTKGGDGGDLGVWSPSRWIWRMRPLSCWLSQRAKVLRA